MLNSRMPNLMNSHNRLGSRPYEHPYTKASERWSNFSQYHTRSQAAKAGLWIQAAWLPSLWAQDAVMSPKDYGLGRCGWSKVGAEHLQPAGRKGRHLHFWEGQVTQSFIENPRNPVSVGTVASLGPGVDWTYLEGSFPSRCHIFWELKGISPWASE